MAEMRRIKTAILASLGLALLLPAAAPATITEVGVLPATTPATVPSCPASPCLAVSRTTGFQVKVGATHNPLAAPRSGTVVAWTISLGKPNATQVKFFNANEGGPSEAGIAILRPQPKPNLTYKLVAQSPLVKLEPYFGKTAQFPLETTIPVKKGDVVALTVPSWAPALALGFGKRHLVARKPSAQGVHEHQRADDRHHDRNPRPVLLPVSDRPPDLQRDADLHPVAALAARRAPSRRGRLNAFPLGAWTLRRACAAGRARAGGRFASAFRAAAFSGGGFFFFARRGAARGAGFGGAFFARFRACFFPIRRWSLRRSCSSFSSPSRLSRSRWWRRPPFPRSCRPAG